MRQSLVRAGTLAGIGALVAFGLRRRAAIRAVAPELRSPTLYVPLGLPHPALVRAITAVLPYMIQPTGPVVDVACRRERATGLDGHGTDVFVYTPKRRDASSGALLWIHGGGHIGGTAAADHALASQIARDVGILVVSVDYRLAPRHPFPADLDDCRAAFHWLRTHAGDLGVNPARIVVGGASAGGGLAAATVQRVHDEGYAIAFQLLVYPMLDDRTTLRARDGTGHFAWTPSLNLAAWTAYLGHRPGRATTPPRYAAPARRPDVSGLPAAWIGVGDLDLFHREDVEYARRLTDAGVACELDVVPGMYHGADAVPEPGPLMTAFRLRMIRALDRAIHG